jgi:FkbM family methyltransferase
MFIKYGFKEKIIDITDICFSKLVRSNILTIPADDIVRGKLFPDPAFGEIKTLYIVDDDNNTTEYDSEKTVKVDINTKKIVSVISTKDINDKLKVIHSKLKIKYGSFNEELNEQRMAISYLTGHEKVLEIGGNIGRNSLLIAHILNEKNNYDFVSLECDQSLAKVLEENRDLNHLKFHVEPSALSKRSLIQKNPEQVNHDKTCQYNFHTVESNIVFDGYTKVSTLTFDELRAKYNIEFDTLILDCEGAFYNILCDMPEILNNINLIIIENDFWEYPHKLYVDMVLKKNNFYVDFVESGGWGECIPFFYQVWKRDVV